MTSPETFEAFNVANPFLGTSLRGGFLYVLPLSSLGFEGAAPKIPWAWSFLG